MRILAARVTRKVYHPRDRVVIWCGQFRRETGLVISEGGKKMHIRLCACPERLKRYTTDGIVLVFKTSCCLIV